MNKSIAWIVVAAVVLAAAGAALRPLFTRQEPGEAAGPEPRRTAEAPDRESPAGRADARDRSDAPPVGLRPRTPPAEGDLTARRRQERLEEERARALEADRRVSLDLLYGDIRAEQEAIDRQRQEIDRELRNAVREIDEYRRQLQAERARLEPEGRADGQPSADAGAPLALQTGPTMRRLGLVFDALPPESAAEIFRQLDRDEGPDTAVNLLNAMNPRRAGRALDELQKTDPALAAHLTARWKGSRVSRSERP